MGMVAAVFEARMSRGQAEELATLLDEARPTRPAGVLAAALLVDGDLAQLVAIWKDRDTLDRYLSETPVPRGLELMRKAGAEPTMRIVDCLDFG